MPRTKRIPGYRLHRPSGQARVILGGKHIYLGPYGTEQSRRAYARLIAERFANQLPSERSESDGPTFPDLTVNELLVRYLEFASRYYVEDDRPTKELTCMKEAMGPLRLLYGDLPAHHFGPLKLKCLRQHLVDAKLSRGVVNHRINRIKRILKWAVSEELIPPAVYQGVRTVAGLKFGRSEARETAPVGPVSDEWVDSTVSMVSPPVAAMIELQRLTGMRPGEVILMRKCDIDTTSEVWSYEPSIHKNRWRGHRRRVPLGPRAQALLKPFLTRESNVFLFSPAEAEAGRNSQRVIDRNPNRKTKVYPCELRARERRREQAAKRSVKRPKGHRFTTDSYRRAINYGIKKLNQQRAKCVPPIDPIPSWHPNQLRHSFATRVRKQFGVEAAQVGLGHARTNIVDVYAEKNLDLAIQVAQMTG